MWVLEMLISWLDLQQAVEHLCELVTGQCDDVLDSLTKPQLCFWCKGTKKSKS
jgi:hypothetical protein